MWVQKIWKFFQWILGIFQSIPPSSFIFCHTLNSCYLCTLNASIAVKLKEYESRNMTNIRMCNIFEYNLRSWPESTKNKEKKKTIHSQRYSLLYKNRQVIFPNVERIWEDFCFEFYTIFFNIRNCDMGWFGIQSVELNGKLNFFPTVAVSIGATLKISYRLFAKRTSRNGSDTPMGTDKPKGGQRRWRQKSWDAKQNKGDTTEKIFSKLLMEEFQDMEKRFKAKSATNAVFSQASWLKNLRKRKWFIRKGKVKQYMNENEITKNAKTDLGLK